MEQEQIKGLDAFYQTIKNYLDGLAQSDELFAKHYAKESNSIDKCCAYIINEVKQSGRIGFSDDEIFGMAIHYYQEDDIKPGEMPKGGKIVSNHTIELTEEEKQEARKQAIVAYQNSIIVDMRNKANAKKKESKAKAEEDATPVPVMNDLFAGL